MKLRKQKTCKHCGDKYVPHHHNQEYCTDQHRKTARWKRRDNTPIRKAYKKKPEIKKRHAEVALKSYHKLNKPIEQNK